MIELRHYAECLVCDWSMKGPKANSAASKHTKDTGHGTVTRSKPA